MIPVWVAEPALKAWTYGVLPLLVLLEMFAFFNPDSPGFFHGTVVVASLGTIYGLHKRQSWAWYVSCLLIFGTLALINGLLPVFIGHYTRVVVLAIMFSCAVVWQRVKPLFSQRAV